MIEPKDKLEKEITEEKSKQSSLNKVELVLYDTEEIYEKEENEKKLRYLKKKKKDKTVITLMKKGQKLRTKKNTGNENSVEEKITKEQKKTLRTKKKH